MIDPPALGSRVAFLLSQLGFQSAQSFTTRLAPLGLTPNRFGLLTHVARAEGQTQQQLAELLGLHRNTMVTLVDDLESQGLVERRRHPEDRRAYAIHLTPAARDLLPAATEAAEAQEASVLAGLTEQEQDQLRTLLLKMATQQGVTSGVHPGLTTHRGHSAKPE
ncbi:MULTISPECIES: MarR family transcriptional regulator [Actinoplanes]|uniref:MarR family winged helix-turn-helix transcriptional regulator n=1 Tax=Actinoplanes TaxID=1865 RepID=UPI0005F28F98|nr:MULTISPECIES: MarR family transcriptional regulator [Actinoplanes]GLY04571.1 MarR family transcriptional regulator [Actinoplanes sp. NBRC 101535]